MISFDSNILLYAFIADSPRHAAAYEFLFSLSERDDVVLSEFVLVEYYTGLRNPALVRRPLSAAKAERNIQKFREHPRWRLVGFSENSRNLHDRLWAAAGKSGFARRRIYDLRLALSLQMHGVTDFATVNVKDFSRCGFVRVWDPFV